MLLNKILFFLNNNIFSKLFNVNSRTYIFNTSDDKRVILASPTKRQLNAFKRTIEDKKKFFSTIAEETKSLEGNVIVDIGANLGYWSMAFNKYFRREKIIFAIEPDKRNVNFLSYNLKNEKNIMIIQAGVGSKNEIKTFGIPDFQKLRKGEQGVNTGNISIYHNNSNSNDKIKIVELDSLLSLFFSKNDRVLIIKIDVEGHEMEVVKGMKNTIDEATPVVILEINPNTQKLAKYNLNELLKYFEKYKCYIPKNINFIIDDKGMPSHSMNMILTPIKFKKNSLDLMGYCEYKK